MLNEAPTDVEKADIHCLRGRLLAVSAPLPVAVGEYDEAIRLDPSAAKAFTGRAVVHAKTATSTVRLRTSPARSAWTRPTAGTSAIAARLTACKASSTRRSRITRRPFASRPRVGLGISIAARCIRKGRRCQSESGLRSRREARTRAIGRKRKRCQERMALSRARAPTISCGAISAVTTICG